MALLPGIAPPPGKCFGMVSIRKMVILSRSVASACLVITVPFALPLLGYVG